MVKTRQNTETEQLLSTTTKLEGKRRSQRIIPIKKGIVTGKNEVVAAKISKRRQTNAENRSFDRQSNEPKTNQPSKISSRRLTISVRTTSPNSVESELRSVLHQEQDKNKHLFDDFLHLQNKYYELVSSFNNEKAHNHRLIEENKHLCEEIVELRKSASTYVNSHIHHDHNYV